MLKIVLIRNGNWIDDFKICSTVLEFIIQKSYDFAISGHFKDRSFNFVYVMKPIIRSGKVFQSVLGRICMDSWVFKHHPISLTKLLTDRSWLSEQWIKQQLETFPNHWAGDRIVATIIICATSSFPKLIGRTSIYLSFYWEV